MLPFVPAMPAIIVGGGLLTSMSLVSSRLSVTGTASMVCPATQAGDVLVWLRNAATSAGTGPASNQPSGFSTKYTNLFGNMRFNIATKIATGSEGGTTISSSNVFASTAILAILRFDSPVLSISSGQSPVGVNTNNNPGSQTITSSSGNAPVLVLAGYYASAAVNPRTFSPTKDIEVGSSNSGLWLACKLFGSSPSNVTIDMDDEGNQNTLVGCYVELGA